MTAKHTCRRNKSEFWEAKIQKIENQFINKIRNFYQKNLRCNLNQRENDLMADIPGKINRWTKTNH